MKLGRTLEHISALVKAHENPPANEAFSMALNRLCMLHKSAQSLAELAMHAANELVARHRELQDEVNRQIEKRGGIKLRRQAHWTGKPAEKDSAHEEVNGACDNANLRPKQARLG